MKWSYNSERSYGIAAWLFVTAAFVVALVVVGGATRLTGSGLSIVEWRPVTGVLPPLTHAGWEAEFAKYRRIPQYTQLNRGISLHDFQALFWWEWGHRLLARVTGLVFLAPLAAYVAIRRIPRRLWWRLGVIGGLFALEPLVGWWMVASGLDHRTAVAPERLALHLGIALAIYSACVLTGLEAWFGRARVAYEPDRKWGWGAPALAVAAYVQCLFGALVAGGRAGLIDGDWPMMGGRVFPTGYWDPARGVLGSLLESGPAVQFNHRLVGYALLLAAVAFAVITQANRFMAPPVRRLAWVFLAAVVAQASLGIGTLRMGDPAWLAGLHQLGAVGVLTAGLALAWRTRRN